MPEGALTRCSRVGELGAGVSRTRGRSSSPGTEGEGVSPQEGEAHGEETGEALRREQFVPHRWQAQRISERPCRGAGVLPLRRREVGVVACALHRVAKLCGGRGGSRQPRLEGDAAALAARPVPGAGKPCCRRESALPARKMLVPAALPGRGFSSEGGAPCGKTRRETGCAGRKASA